MPDSYELTMAEIAFLDGIHADMPLYLNIRRLALSVGTGAEVRVHGTQISFRAPPALCLMFADDGDEPLPLSGKRFPYGPGCSPATPS